jgi:hypothetical protein
MADDDHVQESKDYFQRLVQGNEVENYLNSVHVDKDGATNLDFTQDESVNAPKHYLQGRKIEPLDVIEDWGLDKDYYLASVIKYIARYGRKDGVVGTQCLRKARFYLDRKIRNAGR